MRKTSFYLCAALVYAGAATAQVPRPPLVLQEEGSFFVGGEMTHAEHTGIYRDGSPTPAGSMFAQQMYVQYRLPAERNGLELPLIFVPGGRHTGVAYETTPDGREGWGTNFVRFGFATYIVDPPNVGRSGFNGEAINRGKIENDSDIVPVIGIATLEASWPNFRFGRIYPETYDDTLFPFEAMDQYVRQWFPAVGAFSAIPAWPPAFAALLDKLGPAVLFTHSASGGPGWQTLLMRPDKVSALVAIEPGNCDVDDADVPAFGNTAVLIVFGDHTEGTSWGETAVSCRAFTEKLNEAGGNADFWMLPERGIHGNSHMMMMDKNSHVISREIADWLIEILK